MLLGWGSQATREAHYWSEPGEQSRCWIALARFKAMYASFRFCGELTGIDLAIRMCRDQGTLGQYKDHILPGPMPHAKHYADTREAHGSSRRASVTEQLKRSIERAQNDYQHALDRKYNMFRPTSLNKVPALLYAIFCSCVPTLSRLALGKSTVFDDARSAADNVVDALQFVFLFFSTNSIALVVLAEASTASALTKAHACWVCNCLDLRYNDVFRIRLCAPDGVRAFQSWYKWLYSVHEFESRFHLHALEANCLICIFATLSLFLSSLLGREVEEWMGIMFVIGVSILVAMVGVLTKLAKAHTHFTADVAKGLRRQRRTNKQELRYLARTNMHSPEDGSARTRDLIEANEMVKEMLEELEDDIETVKLFRLVSLTQSNINRGSVLVASALMTAALRAALSRTPLTGT
jgi:hypothetical protein